MRAPCAGTHMQRTTVTCTPAHQRAKLVISCSNQPIQPKSLQQLFVRCAASTQRLWSAAAGHQQQRPLHSNRRSWQQSLCIGAGAGAVACSGSGGGFEPPGSGGWGSGGGGGGWGQTPGSSSPGSNVLAEVAAAGDVSEAAVEEVILLDIGGEQLQHLNMLWWPQMGLVLHCVAWWHRLCMH